MDTIERMGIDGELGAAVSRRAVLRRLGVGAFAAAAAAGGLGLAEAEAKKKKKKDRGPKPGDVPPAPPTGDPGGVPSPTSRARAIGAQSLRATFDYHNRRQVAVWIKYRRYYGNNWFYGWIRDYATGRDLLVWYYAYPRGGIYVYPVI